MISLQDKIQKFEKLIYNKELDDFIPIDEQFIGGGITMQSLIKQNAFIVQEVKKMKNVFVNYCKLNKNVYQKIVQHEVSLHSQTSKIHTLASTIDQKLSDTIKQVKQMYEQMKYESVRTKNLVNEAVRPIEEAINRKVDQASFTKHMKRIIAELDDDLPQGEDGQPGQAGTLSPEDLLIRKRKGKSVALDEYEAEKSKSAKLFLELSQKIEQLQIKNRQFDPIIYRNISSINKLTQVVDTQETQLFKLGRDAKEVRTLVNTTEQRLLTEITNRTSDNVWEVKLSSFESKNVIPRFENLSNEINKNQKQTNHHFADSQSQINKINQKVKSLFEATDNNKRGINNLTESLDQISQKIIDQITVIEEKLNVVYNEKKVKIQLIHQKIDAQVASRIKELQNLNTVIKDLSKTIEEKVLTGVKKNIEVKIHEIDKNILLLNNKEKSTHEQLYLTKGEIHNIKQVLSKKANFTDILVHFERKADKEDFKQLKDKIQTSPSHLRSTILDSPQRTRRTISANSRKMSSLSKNYINPVSVLNEDENISIEFENQRSSRMFIMGLENEMGFQNDRRRMSYTESTRRKKKLKSTTGILNLLTHG